MNKIKTPEEILCECLHESSINDMYANDSFRGKVHGAIEACEKYHAQFSAREIDESELLAEIVHFISSNDYIPDKKHPVAFTHDEVLQIVTHIQNHLFSQSGVKADERNCENCKYTNVGGFGYPCNNCKTNYRWEPKEVKPAEPVADKKKPVEEEYSEVFLDNKLSKLNWHPVEFVGFWEIMDEPFYEAKNVLNAEDVGEKSAKENAELAASAPELLRENMELKMKLGLPPLVADKTATRDESEIDDKKLLDWLGKNGKIPTYHKEPTEFLEFTFNFEELLKLLTSQKGEQEEKKGMKE